MLKKLALWFICFGLSFLVESIGWAGQGKAFMVIYLGGSGLIITFLILVCLFAGNGLGERIGFSLIALIIYIVNLAIILFATWGATKLFNVDYYVTFQIMEFGQCLCDSDKENN